MAYDLEEQEQLDTLKAWWKQYGNLVTWLLIAVMLAYAGWTYWNKQQGSDAQQASQLYEDYKKLAQGAGKDDADKAKRLAGELVEKYSGTAYAPMAALGLAKSAYDAGDLKAAKAQLNWVIDHGKVAEYKSVAHLRLAGILLDEKSYDDALSHLDGDATGPFAAAIAERRGDILVEMNKPADALVAYQKAFDGTKEGEPARQIILTKLEAVGGPIAEKDADNKAAKK
jgi:predicted negative regulator of RcsB-dependent stress response